MNIDPEQWPTRSRRSVRTVAVALLLTAATAVTVTNAFASTTTPAAKAPIAKAPIAKAASAVALVPAQGALLGHYYGNGTIAATDARIGRKPTIHLTYYDFKGDDWVKSSVNTSDFASGRIPLVNVEPNNINFTDIINGKYDAMLKKRADDAKAIGKQFFVDFAAEMNGDEGWGGHNAAKYIAAWRHLHDIFVARGATNVVWAWCPNNEDAEGPAAMSYYPGDQYVDWTGIDGYNWGTSDPDFEWQTFRQVFAGLYPKLAGKGKPIIIAEMASDEAGGSKATWINDIIPTLKNDYPLIKAIVWFDVDKERHWQITSSGSTLTAYQRMAKDPFMNP